MKFLKHIITSLILAITLIILTSGSVFAADTWSVQIREESETGYHSHGYSFVVLKNGVIQKVDDLKGLTITLSNPYNSSAPVVSFDIEGSYNIYAVDENFDYNEDRAGQRIYINTDALGDLVAGINVTIENSDKILLDQEYDISSTVEPSTPPLPSDISFEIQMVNLDNGYYVLSVENTTFDMIGDFYLCFGNSNGELVENSTGTEMYLNKGKKGVYPGRTLSIKQQSSGKVIGSFTVPGIESIRAETTLNSANQIEVVLKGTFSSGQVRTLTLQDLKSYGWEKIYLKESTGWFKKTFSINISNGSTNDSNVSFSNNKIIIKQLASYDLTIKGAYDDTAYTTTVFALDTTPFTAFLTREGDVYFLNYATSLKELERINAGKNFEIKLTEVGGNESLLKNKITSDYRTPSNVKQRFDNNKDLLYLQKQVDLHFICDATGLNVVRTIDVPQLDSIDDLIAVIDERLKITLKNKENRLIDSDEFYKILGYAADPGNSLRIGVYYDTGAVNRKLDESYFYSSKVEIDSSCLWDPENLSAYLADLDPEEEFVLGSMKTTYDFYTAVKNSPNKDAQIYLIFKLANGQQVKLKVTTPTMGNYRQFEAITGYKFSEYEEAMAGFAEVLQSSATAVVGGKLQIKDDEESKLFYVPESGIYFIAEVDETGITGEIPYITVPMTMVADEVPLMFAGRFTGEEQEGKPLGEYVYYSSETISFGKSDFEANCFPLVGGAIYKILNLNNTNKTVLFTNISNVSGDTLGLVEIVDEAASNYYRLSQNTRPGYDEVKVAYILAKDFSFFEALGSMIARFIRTLANGLNYLVQFSLQSVGGEKFSSTIDIDSIIFNHYPDTSIAFFSSNNGGDTPSKMIGLFRDGVNKWYSVFNGIAIAGYLVILLYIGVKILLGVGSGKSAQFKELLLAWVTGLVLLIFFPYAVKYAIDVNNMLVAMIEDSKTTQFGIEDIDDAVDMSDFTLPDRVKEEDLKNLGSQMEQNPYGSNDNSYMAHMAKIAHENSSDIVSAVVYLIMVWQFIMLAILYYKRVFSIAFLVAIFPFVALSYAIDKIGDGHAGAFSTWTKEIMVNIFVQSIHALVYVFVIGATYQGSTYSGDWLLSIIGIMFLFQGEEILKKMTGFGGQGTVRSLKQTAQRAVKTVVATKAATMSIANNVVGAKSHLGRTVSTFREMRKEKLIAKNMDILAPDNRKPTKAKELSTYDPTRSWDNNYNQLSRDIQILNNRDGTVDTETFARALDNVLSNRNSSQAHIQGLMNGLNLSDEQLDALAQAQSKMVADMIDGDKSTLEKYESLKEKVDKDLDATLAIIFPEGHERRDLLKRAMYFRLRDGNDDEKHKQRSTNFAEVEAEYNRAKDRRNQFFNPLLNSDNPFSDEVTPTYLSADAISRRDSVLATYFNKSAANASKEEARIAESIAILKDFSEQNHRSRISSRASVKYTPRQVMDAANYLTEHQKDSRASNTAVKTTLGIDAKDIRSIVAEEVAKNYTATNQADKKDFRKDLDKAPKFKKPEPSSGTSIEKRIAVGATEKTWREAMAMIIQDEKAAGDMHCYEESLDIVDVKDVMRKERETHYSESDYIDYLVEERKIRNMEEINFIEEFAREQLEDLPEITSAPTYEGMTKEEHEAYSKELRAKFVEELSRTAATTSGVILGASIGAGLNVGLSDDASAFAEAFDGAAVGTVAGDFLAERAMGREDKVKNVKILNPYTGQIEEFELRKEGITRDSFGVASIGKNETLRYDDPRLEGFGYNLEIQYRKHQKEAVQKAELERKVYITKL